MKKTICTLLSIICVFATMTGCQNNDYNYEERIEELMDENISLRSENLLLKEQLNEQTATTTRTDTTMMTTKEETTTAAIPNGKWDATYKDCYVKLNGATIVERSDGESVAVIEITFRNESEETRSCGLTFAIDAYQDGIECDNTVLFGEIGDEFDTGTNVTDIKPGVELTVYKAYIMRNDTSDVVVDVRGLYDLDKKVLFEMTYTI